MAVSVVDRSESPGSCLRIPRYPKAVVGLLGSRDRVHGVPGAARLLLDWLHPDTAGCGAAVVFPLVCEDDSSPPVGGAMPCPLSLQSPRVPELVLAYWWVRLVLGPNPVC